MSPIRTLIADDVEDLRMTYKVLLEATGRFAVVAEAGDGASAIELAREHQPDLVILDIAISNGGVHAQQRER